MINIQGRIMHFLPLAGYADYDPEVFAIDGQAIRETLRAFQDRGGDANLLAGKLNDHLPTRAAPISLADLQNAAHAWTHEFAFYLSCFCKEILGDPGFRYGQGTATLLGKGHKLIEKGRMEHLPWAKTQQEPPVRDYEIKSTKAYLLLLEESSAYSVAELYNWLNQSLPLGYVCPDKLFEGKPFWCSWEFINYTIEFIKILTNRASVILEGSKQLALDECREIPFMTRLPRGFIRAAIKELSSRVADMKSATITELNRSRLAVRFKTDGDLVMSKCGPFLASLWDNNARSWAGAMEGVFSLEEEFGGSTASSIYPLEDKAYPDMLIRVVRDISAYRPWNKVLPILAVLGGLGALSFFLINNFPIFLSSLGILTILMATLAGWFFILFQRERRLRDRQALSAKRHMDTMERSSSELLRTRSQLELLVQQRTAELSAANLELQQAEARRSTFFANVSHELKTPLTLIRAPLEEIRRGRHGQSIDISHPLLSTLERNTERMQKLVGTILNILEHEELNQSPADAPLDIVQATRTILADFDSPARHKNQELRLSAPVGTAIMAACASDTFDTIVQNLVSNALKYTAEGGAIAVEIKAAGQNQYLDPRPSVHVSDNGIGIANERLPELFRRFHQVYDQERNDFEGSGLGLALSNELAQRIGGEIRVQSAPGQGSTFSLFLPLAPDQAPSHSPGVAFSPAESPVSTIFDADMIKTHTEAPPSPASLNQPGHVIDATILLIDDNQDLLDFLTAVLGKAYHVLSAHDGIEALEVLQTTRPGKIQAIICDLMMPRMDGWTFLAKVRETAEFKNLPFLFLTARQPINERVAGLLQGAVDWMVKPFSVQELEAKLQAILRFRAGTVDDTLSRLRQAIDGGGAANSLGPHDGGNYAGRLERHLDAWRLSPRDREVIRMVAHGLSDKEIADKLNVAPQTVSNRLSKLYREIGVSSRAGLVSRIQSE